MGGEGAYGGTYRKKTAGKQRLKNASKHRKRNAKKTKDGHKGRREHTTGAKMISKGEGQKRSPALKHRRQTGENRKEKR